MSVTPGGVEQPASGRDASPVPSAGATSGTEAASVRREHDRQSLDVRFPELAHVDGLDDAARIAVFDGVLDALTRELDGIDR